MTSDVHPPITAPARRAAIASLVGTTVEWYDFFIYATAAALVFRGVFFPADLNPVLGTIAAFGTTSFGYLGRPLGAALFGHLGDKVGRKKSLVVTILLMGAATFGIGLLPGHDVLGPAAPLLLIVLRLAQGVAVGGEWGGAALMAVEHAPRGRRTLMGSFAQVGSPVGALLSSGMFAVASAIGPLESGTWRIPFLFSAVLVVIGLVIRLRVEESPVFRTLVEQGERARAPLAEALTRYRGRVLLAAGAMFVATGGYYVTSSFWLVYATASGGLRDTVALNVLTVEAAFEMACTLLAGWLGDRFGPRPVVVTGLVLAAVVAPVWLAVSHSGSLPLVLVFAALIAVPTGAHYGPMARFLTELFPPRIRYSAMSMAYQLAALTAGALTPVVVSALYSLRAGRPDLVVAYLTMLCALSAVCVVVVWRRRDQENTRVLVEKENRK
ncbi:MFS transporter [Nocardia alni]|uniref:MFS transporter n=1 Tax=Nocardia alni TaxID=2815723 RepID=UPI001C235EF0|nr:MFS transporter [Nocardia alni]